MDYFDAPEPGTEVPCVERWQFEIHRMPDTGHNDEPAVRHCRSHRPEVGRRNPAIPLAPQHQVWMMDLRHAAL